MIAGRLAPLFLIAVAVGCGGASQIETKAAVRGRFRPGIGFA